MLLLRLLMLFGLFCWEQSSSRDCIVDCWAYRECDIYEGRSWLVEHFDLNRMENKKLVGTLVYAHNGLRNRLASKLGTCDMLALRWNDNLAIAANSYHRKSLRTVNCTAQPTLENIRMLRRDKKFSRMSKNRRDYVGSNSFFTTNLFTPEFFAGALSSWYRLHSKLPFPETLNRLDNKYFQLNAINAFVNIINPNTRELGCSYAIFNNGRSLICLYFPSTHSNGTIHLRARPKQYECPAIYPLFDKIFTSICIPFTA